MNLSLIESQWLNSNKHFREAFDFYLMWRSKNRNVPTHLVVFEYLLLNNFTWANLRDKSSDSQPHYFMNEINRLYDMDISIIAIAIAQFTNEAKIHQYILEMAKNSIERQLDDRIKNRVTRIRYIKWEDTFVKIYKILENNTTIELPNNNHKFFQHYFDKKE